MNDGSIQSLGVGVEAEVLFTALTQLQEHPGQWFYPRIDNMASIAVMHSYSSSRNLSSSRREGMRIFGAITALLLSQGVPPLPLSPIFLQWIIFGCNIHSLHSDLISEWYPELFATIKHWLATGPKGPISSFQGHFSTWHETQVSLKRSCKACINLPPQIGLYHERDEASHNSLAAEMLYRPIIGNEPPQHPEIQAFLDGFRLPCPNGFDFIHVCVQSTYPVLTILKQDITRF
jgi:hypothetical protein